MLSDGIAWVLRRVVKYRRGVIDGNLAIAFPEKSVEERASIRDGFYTHLTDVSLEQTWLFAASADELRAHCRCVNPEVYHDAAKLGRPIIMCAGHQGNYEMSAVSLGIYFPARVAAIYARLRNPYFDERVKETRSRFGLEMWARGDESQEHLREVVSNPEPIVLCFAFDQCPHPGRSKYWYPYFGKEAAHMRGVEAYAHKLDAVVLYGSVLPGKRGQATFEIELVTDKPRVLPEGAILADLTRRLERAIRRQPSKYLWSHRRWKLDREHHLGPRDTVIPHDVLLAAQPD